MLQSQKICFLHENYKKALLFVITEYNSYFNNNYSHHFVNPVSTHDVVNINNIVNK